MISASRPLLALLIAFALASLPGFLSDPAGAAGATCPKCGAPLEPGARFCNQCGARVEGENPAAAASAGPDPKQSVVQVVAIHDKEMTSLLESLVYGSTVRVDSLLGSGYAIAAGEFLTDASLLLGAKEVRVRDSGGRTVPARIVGVDPQIGIGILAADVASAPPVPRREGAPIREGESLTALGISSAPGMATAVTASPGVVSGLHRGGMEIHPVEDYIQTDASLARGFAGGPGVDSQGRLVGMSTALPLGRRLVLGPAVGIGLFIPADWIDRGVAWIRAGKPPRPWLGAHAVHADPDTRKLFGLPGEIRWVVEDVFPDSPAATAGMRRGDGIRKVQGEEMTSLAAIQSRVLAAKPGDSWTVEVQRQGERLTLPVQLKERPERPRLKGTDALRLYGGLEIGSGTSPGLQITRILPGSEASASKLTVGDSLLSLFTKKELEHPEKSDARWRGVRDLPELEEQIGKAYSDLDFVIGLKFKCKDGDKREIFLYYLLTATDAL